MLLCPFVSQGAPIDLTTKINGKFQIPAKQLSVVNFPRNLLVYPGFRSFRHNETLEPGNVGDTRLRSHRATRQNFSNKWIDCPVSIDLSSLPVKTEIVFPLRRSFPFFLFGLGWSLAAFLLFAQTTMSGPLVIIFSASLFAAGFGILMRSLSYVGARLSICFDKDVITIKDSSIFRPGKPHQLQYQDMKGLVVRQIEEVIDGETKFYQIIELLHDDHRHIVPLYIQVEEETPERTIVGYSERLSLPMFRAQTLSTDSLEVFKPGYLIESAAHKLHSDGVSPGQQVRHG